MCTDILKGSPNESLLMAVVVQKDCSYAFTIGSLARIELEVDCGFFFSSRRRHTRFDCDWSSDVCSSDLDRPQLVRDVTAGVIVGIVALPLAIAFAIASGVTPDRGLWTAIIAGFIISAFGEIGRASCRERV